MEQNKEGHFNAPDFVRDFLYLSHRIFMWEIEDNMLFFFRV